MRKFSSAIGIFIVSQILQFSGYVKPEDIEEGGILRKVMMEQPESVITALKVIVVALPLVLLTVTYLMARRYPLTQAIHARLRTQLEYIRSSRERGLNPVELAELKGLLIGKEKQS
jgi:Na+/melibiose symporter-like transporter